VPCASKASDCGLPLGVGSTKGGGGGSRIARTSLPFWSYSLIVESSTPDTNQFPLGARAIPDAVLWKRKFERVTRPSSTSGEPIALVRPQPPGASGAVGHEPLKRNTAPCSGDETRMSSPSIAIPVAVPIVSSSTQ